MQQYQHQQRQEHQRNHLSVLPSCTAQSQRAHYGVRQGRARPAAGSAAC
jgi:hypothetical protein